MSEYTVEASSMLQLQWLATTQIFGTPDHRNSTAVGQTYSTLFCAIGYLMIVTKGPDGMNITRGTRVPGDI